MLFRNSPTRYATASILMHWLMLALVVAAYASIELREFFPKGSEPREALKSLHTLVGLSILALALVRLGLRGIAGPVPPIEPAPGTWTHRAAVLVQIGLYVLLIGVPLVGWGLLSAEGKPIPFFGLDLPPLAGPDQGRAETLEELHELGGQVGYGLIALHAAAGLLHHFLRRDNTLKRMLPGAR